MGHVLTRSVPLQAQFVDMHLAAYIPPDILLESGGFSAEMDLNDVMVSDSLQLWYLTRRELSTDGHSMYLESCSACCHALQLSRRFMRSSCMLCAHQWMTTTRACPV